MKIAHIALLFRGLGDVGGKEFGLIQDGFQDGGRGLPVVVALSGNDQGLLGSLLLTRLEEEKPCEQQEKRISFFHVGMYLDLCVECFYTE